DPSAAPARVLPARREPEGTPSRRTRGHFPRAQKPPRIAVGVGCFGRRSNADPASGHIPGERRGPRGGGCDRHGHRPEGAIRLAFRCACREHRFILPLALAVESRGCRGGRFLIAWRRLDDVPAGDAARAWLYAVARKVLANQARADARRERLSAKLGAQPVPARTEEAPLAVHVHEALAAIAPRDREVLLLAEWEGLTLTAIASVMRCPVG